MKYAWLLCAACTTRTPVAPEAWQLDQDRVVAVRSTPPGLAAGEHALVDALIAHAEGPTTVEPPSTLNAAHSPLFGTVNYLFDHFELIAPDDATLADARSELGIEAGAPIPLEVECDFETFTFITQKQVLLGTHADNPALSQILIAGQPPAATVTLARETDIALHAAGFTTRWLTSCGELRDSDEPDAVLTTGAACEGELVVVERDDTVGVVWQMWPLVVE
ncbi:MAG TPA: hypothetical protein VFQ65_34525 [Kofleriaceae bacterium]|nr:hypothetical protein [Kofleriaceae bacterium]